MREIIRPPPARMPGTGWRTFLGQLFCDRDISGSMGGDRETQTSEFAASSENTPAEHPPLGPDSVRGAEAVILLPTLNEEGGLLRVLGELAPVLDSLRGRRILPMVIDGGSRDRTVAIAQRAGIPVLHQQSTGKGAAVVEAFARLHALDVRDVVVLDADATYPPDRVPAALGLLRGDSDLVIGVRHPVWGPPRDFRDLVHRAGNVVLSGTASILSRQSILDLCSGFWAVSTAHFLDLDISSSSFAIEAELVLKSLGRGYRVCQIPVAYRERIGRAKLRAARDGFRIFQSILVHGRRGPTPASGGPFAADIAPQLLRIGAIAGASNAILEAPPSFGAEACHLGRALNDGSLATSVTYDRTPLPSPSGPSPWPPESTASMIVRLAPGGIGAGGEASTTVSIRLRHRQLVIALNPAAPSAAPTPPGPSAAPNLFDRAGGYTSRALGISSPQGRVLRSRLDLDPVHRQASLLAANGFRVAESIPAMMGAGAGEDRRMPPPRVAGPSTP